MLQVSFWIGEIKFWSENFLTPHVHNNYVILVDFGRLLWVLV